MDDKRYVTIGDVEYELTFENARKLAGLKCSIIRPELSGARRASYIALQTRKWRGCTNCKRVKCLRENIAIQKGCCEWCKRPFTKERWATLEHLIPVSKRGPTTMKNTIAICEPCRSGAYHAPKP